MDDKKAAVSGADKTKALAAALAQIEKQYGKGAVMKLGVMLEGQEGLTWDLWRRLMSRVEELGFESLWRSDHFMSLEDSSRDALETWVALTLTAAETTV